METQEGPPEAGCARRRVDDRRLGERKKRVHGGNMVSPMTVKSS
jgi:hypothetical protein